MYILITLETFLVSIVNDFAIHVLASGQIHQTLVLYLMGGRMIVANRQEKHGSVEIPIGKLLHKDQVVGGPTLLLVDLFNRRFSCIDGTFEVRHSFLNDEISTHPTNRGRPGPSHCTINGQHGVSKVVIGNTHGLGIFQLGEQIEGFREGLVRLLEITGIKGQGPKPDHCGQSLKGSADLLDFLAAPFNLRKVGVINARQSDAHTRNETFTRTS
mmetsp:Transcript_2876/g.6412  ORF Transcript_2876/g.6412 Transcript_2876/m.6412 type:complete len:214 (-) Transcript_2876:2550-3191(-)